MKVARDLYNARLIDRDAALVAAGYYSGPTSDKGLGHGNSTLEGVTHPRYNTLVEEDFRAYIKNNKINKMNAEEMKTYIDRIASLDKSLDADINKYNAEVHRLRISGGTPTKTDAAGYAARGKSYVQRNPGRFKGMALMGALGTLFGCIGCVQKAQALTQSPALANAIQALEQGDINGAREALVDPIKGLGVEMEKNDIRFPGTTLPPSEAIEQWVDKGIDQMNQYASDLTGMPYNFGGGMVRIEGKMYTAPELDDSRDLSNYGWDWMKVGDEWLPFLYDEGDEVIPLLPLGE